jgi:hypothetical protein
VTDLAEDFVLHDQFDRPHAVRFADAALTLLVFSGRTTADDGVAWGRLLPAAVAEAGGPAVRVVGIGAMGAVPALVRPLVRRALRDQPPLPLDWDDTVARRFGYAAGAVRVVLVDDTGRARAGASGAPTSEVVAWMADAAVR